MGLEEASNRGSCREISGFLLLFYQLCGCNISGNITEPNLISGAFSLLLKPITELVLSSGFCLLLHNWAPGSILPPVVFFGRHLMYYWGKKSCARVAEDCAVGFHHGTASLMQIETDLCACGGCKENIVWWSGSTVRVGCFKALPSSRSLLLIVMFGFCLPLKSQKIVF